MRITTSSRNMHRPVRTSCPRCGKRCYASRKIAKQQARILFPGQHMGVYDCDWFETKWFHLTSEPQRKKEARKEARGTMKEREEAFVETALNEMYEKAEKSGDAPVFTVGGKAWDEWGDLEEAFPADMGISPREGAVLPVTAAEAAQVMEALEGHDE